MIFGHEDGAHDATATCGATLSLRTGPVVSQLEEGNGVRQPLDKFNGEGGFSFEILRELRAHDNFWMDPTSGQR